MRFPSWLFGGPRQRAMAWIDPGELHRRLVVGDRVLVVDVRDREEFAGALGHIAGAVNLPLVELPGRLAELAATAQPLVLVCLTDKRSSQAAASLRAAGHRDVAVLRGGMDRWRREGFDGQP